MSQFPFRHFCSTTAEEEERAGASAGDSDRAAATEDKDGGSTGQSEVPVPVPDADAAAAINEDENECAQPEQAACIKLCSARMTWGFVVVGCGLANQKSVRRQTQRPQRFHFQFQAPPPP